MNNVQADFNRIEIVQDLDKGDLGKYFTYGSVPHFSLKFACMWTLG